MSQHGRGEFRVTVTKEDLVFAAAHFITLPGHRCEALHGHNYRAGVVVEGGLEPDAWYVVDFAALKRLMKRLTDELDHRVLLPTENPRITLRREGESLEVVFDGQARYRFPASDCVLLPVPNTTVEMLAEHLARQAATELAQSGARTARAIEVEVEENFGQSATYRTVLD
jgi:6-pyruvoyltetrahydropterin/6-carboxytetrahydropterin synthase